MVSFRNLILRFIAPMLGGCFLGVATIFLMKHHVVASNFPVRIAYTFSDNFIGFLKWFSPFMSLVLIASGIRGISQNVYRFLIRFSVILITTLVTLGLATFALSKLIIPIYIADINFTDSLELTSYFTIPFFHYFSVFTGMILGIIVGVLANYLSFINSPLNRCERIVNWVVVNIIIKFSPLWIIGSFAATTFTSQNLSIVWYDLWLSFIILFFQFSWLLLMYYLLSKYGNIPFKLIVKGGMKIYMIVLSMGGMTSGAIYPYLIEEQSKIGLNRDKSKFVTVASFNMPGSLISHIVFALGLSMLFGIEFTNIQFIKYIIVLIFTLVVSPAISGGVFALTSPLLIPMLGFNDQMVGLMSAMYFKQGTSNAAVNNCADFYLTGLSMDASEFTAKK